MTAVGTLLHGSCHCGTVRFTMRSSSYVPYQLCLCSVCRKVGGALGTINLGGHSDSLEILQGKDDIKVYKGVLERDTPEEHVQKAERNFCGKCSTMLWLYNSTWPELIHPFAPAIDDELPVPEKMVVIFNEPSVPAYARAKLPEGPKENFENVPIESLESWHKKEGLWVE